MRNSPIRDAVLWVDAPGTGAQMVHDTLADGGFEVHVASSGAHALTLLPTMSFSAAVVSTSLPDMSGGVCIHKLLQIDRELPCIEIADAPTLECATEAANLCVQGYLVYPFTPQELLTLVSRAVERRRLHLALKEERIQTARLLGILQTIETIQDRINNPLQVLLGYAELLSVEVPQNGGDPRQFMDRILESGAVIADVVGKLRHVRRPVTRKWSFGESLDLEAAGPEESDRRRYPRVISAMLARIRGRTSRRWYYIENLGKGGLSIHTSDADELPEVVEMELADPESGETYHCRAQLIWVDSHFSRAGLRFLEIDPALVDYLVPEGEEIVSPNEIA